MSKTSRKLRPSNAMHQWMTQATVEEQQALADAVGTSRGLLYQVSGGRRSFSSGKAGAIERETAAMHLATRGRLPKLYRTDLSVACAGCAYAQQCLGPVATRADFPVLEDQSEVVSHND
jgi:DNA-binding transcriptional regulator YdaS (Cro superfamily)